MGRDICMKGTLFSHQPVGSPDTLSRTGMAAGTLRRKPTVGVSQRTVVNLLSGHDWEHGARGLDGAAHGAHRLLLPRRINRLVRSALASDARSEMSLACGRKLEKRAFELASEAVARCLLGVCGLGL